MLVFSRPDLVKSLSCYSVASVCSVVCLYERYCGYWQPTRSHIWEINWYQNEWHWPLFRGHIKVMPTIALHSMLNISETVRDLVPKDHQ